MPKISPYSKEFKQEAVQLLRTSGRPVPQLAKELGVSPQSLRNWAAQHDVDDGDAEGLSSQERDELRRLRRENKILAEEREILRKAAACVTTNGGGRWGVGALVAEAGAVQDMEVWPSVAALQGEAANHRKLLRSRAVVVSVAEKARRERVRCGLRRRT